MLKAINKIKGAGRNNIYYRINDEITLLNRKGVAFIVDTKWVYELKNLAVIHRIKPNGKLDACCYLMGTDDKMHKISLGKISSDLEAGKVKDLHKGMIYPYDGEECHHKYARIDNRACAVLSLTKEEHTKVHMNEYGGNRKSHHFLELKIMYRINTDTGEMEEYFDDEVLSEYLSIYE
ncbi:MAG: hypothetical protein K1W35_04190 [Lachnospiraceae bacterium]